MSFWNELRASGVNLTERYCVSCKTRKHISLFPKHQKRKKSRTCFECLGEIKCRTCNELKSYEEFIDQYKGARKSKIECWNCYIERKNKRSRDSYPRRKREGKIKHNSETPLNSQYWAKISSRKRESSKSRSIKIEITPTEFRSWFKKNYTGKCYYCDVSIDEYRSSNFLKKIRPHIRNFGIDRKDTTRGYSIDNIVVACNLCNSVKGSFFNDEEFKEIGKKYIRKLYD